MSRGALFAAWMAGACAGSTPSETGSIGAILRRSELDGAVYIHEAPPGLAAEVAGLEEGDRIKMVDGVLVDDLSAARLQQLLRGPVGSVVTLTVLRREDQVEQIGVERRALLAPASSASAR